eukprot:COSAG01_NODE_66623_length_269_cov_1.123529_1_plen_58_part_10
MQGSKVMIKTIILRACICQHYGCLRHGSACCSGQLSSCRCRSCRRSAHTYHTYTHRSC